MRPRPPCCNSNLPLKGRGDVLRTSTDNRLNRFGTIFESNPQTVLLISRAPAEVESSSVSNRAVIARHRGGNGRQERKTDATSTGSPCRARLSLDPRSRVRRATREGRPPVYTGAHP